MEYRPGQPGPVLAGAVEAFWHLRMERQHPTEQILPLPSVEVIVTLGERYRLLGEEGGPSDRPVPAVFTTGLRRGPVRIANPPVIDHLAVRLPVHGLCRFGVSPAGSVEEVPGSFGEALDRLRGWALGRTPGPEELLARTAATLEECLLPESGPQAVVRQAVGLLAADPTRPVGGVATELGISHQHLIANFHRYVGRPPKWVAQLFLVHRFLEQVPGQGPLPTWTALVADSPYADQSHFIRSFTRMTGLSPRAFLAARAGSRYGDPRFLGGEA